MLEICDFFSCSNSFSRVSSIETKPLMFNFTSLDKGSPGSSFYSGARLLCRSLWDWGTFSPGCKEWFLAEINGSIWASLFDGVRPPPNSCTDCVRKLSLAFLVCGSSWMRPELLPFTDNSRFDRFLWAYPGKLNCYNCVFLRRLSRTKLVDCYDGLPPASLVACLSNLGEDCIFRAFSFWASIWV